MGLREARSNMDTLRPLGFGELFDRAITLYVRNFLAFVGIALVELVPLALFSWYLDSRQVSEISSLLVRIFHVTPAASASSAASPDPMGGILIGLPIVAADSIAYAAICLVFWPQPAPNRSLQRNA